MLGLLDSLIYRNWRRSFEGRSARRYARDARPAFGDLDDRLLDGLALDGVARLLDLGCGPATFAARARVRFPTLTVIAIDPSSPFSGGALLGDRVRMHRHSLDPGVFIRSLATRGHLGGLSRSTFDIAHVFDAMGFQRIVIETVGVGQDEVDVMAAAHTTVVVSVPGLGDEVQAIKAGLLEIADVLVVNKSDREGADRTVRDLRHMLGLRAAHDHEVAVVSTVATCGTGITELVAAIEAHRATAWSGPGAATRATARARAHLEGLVRAMLAERASRVLASHVTDPAVDVAERRKDPWSIAEELVALSGTL